MEKRQIYFDVFSVISVWQGLTIYMLNFPEDINLYLQFILRLHNDCTQTVEILPRVRQELTYSTLLISWVLMSCNTRSQGISNHDIDLIKPWITRSRMLRVNIKAYHNSITCSQINLLIHVYSVRSRSQENKWDLPTILVLLGPQDIIAW